MAKAKKKYEIPHSDYLEKSDFSFCLVAFPAHLIADVDIVRDAIITYIPGYDRKDFDVLKDMLEWIDNVEDVMCVPTDGD